MLDCYCDYCQTVFPFKRIVPFPCSHMHCEGFLRLLRKYNHSFTVVLPVWWQEPRVPRANATHARGKQTDMSKIQIFLLLSLRRYKTCCSSHEGFFNNPFIPPFFL